ncbi:MAG: response regulator transcription factor, partial [Bacteroidales bacterium]|nr:response regulator transcription factor [Bacteroidales bacterium]
MDDKIAIMIVDDEPIIRKAIKYELNSRHEQIDCRMDDDGHIQRREVEVTDTFASGPQLFAALNDPQRPRPDYLLVDMEFQGEPTGGIFITERIRKQYKTLLGADIKIIILSGRFDNPLPNEANRTQRLREIGGVVFEALHKGANAFISKNATGGFSIENILHAISCLERGESYYFNYPVMRTLKEAAELYFERERTQPLDEPLTDQEKEILLLEAAGCTAQEIAQRLPNSVETDKSIQEKQKEISRKFNIVNKSGARIAKALQHHLIDP